jgi:hypothetical protein
MLSSGNIRESSLPPGYIDRDIDHLEGSLRLSDHQVLFLFSTS